MCQDLNTLARDALLEARIRPRGSPQLELGTPWIPRIAGDAEAHT